MLNCKQYTIDCIVSNGRFNYEKLLKSNDKWSEIRCIIYTYFFFLEYIQYIQNFYIFIAFTKNIFISFTENVLNKIYSNIQDIRD